MNKLKILHLCLTGPYTDNLNYQENMLTKFQKKLNNEVYIVASQWYWEKNGNIRYTSRTKYTNDDGIKIYRLPIIGHNRNVFFRYKKYRYFMDSLNEIRPDIIFVHNLQFFDVLKLIKYKKKFPNIKIFVDNHSDFSNSARNIISKIFYKTVWRRVALKVNPYVEKFWGVLPSRVEFLKDIYKLPKEKCDLLIMGGDDECIEKAKGSSNKIRRKYSICNSDFLIVTGGKIDLYKKETLDLMKSITMINENGRLKKNIKLIVFGSVAKELKELFHYYLGDENIFYAGWLTEQESYDYFNASDLVVFPGRHSVYWEEVVSIGIPLICKSWDGIKHINIGGNVVFLKNTSADNLSKTIVDVIKYKLKIMKKNAENKKNKSFLYSEICLKSIEVEEGKNEID